MMTAYSKEKLKTILMQNFGGKHRVLLTMWKLWLINPSNVFLGEVKNENFKRLSVHEAETGRWNRIATIRRCAIKFADDCRSF